VTLKWNGYEEQTTNTQQEFYAKTGWYPFPSTHVSLPSLPEADYKTLLTTTASRQSHIVPGPRPLKASDLAVLCLDDEKVLRKSLSLAPLPPGKKARVAFVPNVETMAWHHSREEFFAKELLDTYPEAKGAIIGEKEGERAWVIWTRVWGEEPEQDKATASGTLYILRLVCEGEDYLITALPGQEHSQITLNRKDSQSQIFALLLEAQKEAGLWGMKDVKLWNPTAVGLSGCQMAHDLNQSQISPKDVKPLKIVVRETDSIASLMWYPMSDIPERNISHEEVEWACNEKYGWC
jgi:hypothetical protein